MLDYLARHADPGSDLDAAGLVVQELVVNALEHTSGPAWVELTWTDDQPDLTICDLGAGFELPASGAGRAVAHADLDLSDSGAAPYDLDGGDHPDLMAEGGRGLFLVTHLADELAVAARAAGGTRVRARLPVSRAESPSIQPVRQVDGALPALDEAEPTGGFSRESFLRALVVQLSRAVERTAGPSLNEWAVAEVGLTVGGQMEAEFRAARNLTGTLTAEEIAECLVRLKAAIGGRFYVVELSEERIVLGNEQCPFGNAVRKAPGLCRMTSTVFGGIAARNHPDGAAVVLEERIAVGDPGCRVVVHLGEPPEEARRFAHRYHGSADPPAE